MGHCVRMATLPLDPPHVEAFEPSPDLAALRDQRVRAVVWLTLIFWVSNYLLLTLATALTGNAHLQGIVLVRCGELLVGLCFSFGIHLMLRRLKTTRKRLIALAIFAPILAETFAWGVFFAEATVDPSLTLSIVTWAAVVRTITFWLARPTRTARESLFSANISLRAAPRASGSVTSPSRVTPGASPAIAVRPSLTPPLVVTSVAATLPASMSSPTTVCALDAEGMRKARPQGTCRRTGPSA